MNFASKSVIHENPLGSFTCRKAGTWDILFYFPSEGRHTEDFSDARKIHRLRPGLNPRTRVPVASMLTTRPPKLSCGAHKRSFFFLTGKSKNCSQPLRSEGFVRFATCRSFSNSEQLWNFIISYPRNTILCSKLCNVFLLMQMLLNTQLKYVAYNEKSKSLLLHIMHNSKSESIHTNYVFYWCNSSYSF